MFPLPSVFQQGFNNPYNNNNHQVQNPRSNATFDIPQGLQPGKQIIISGVVLNNCDRFEIDLEGSRGTALHINPRLTGQFGANTIVRNSNLGGWGDEENDGPFPFRHGQPFELAILTEQDRYRVSVNGAHAFDFKARGPINDVQRLKIEGNVTVNRIQFNGAEQPTQQGHITSSSSSFSSSTSTSSHSLTVNSPSVPFATPISGGPTPGRMIQISGQVPHNSDNFAINLQNGQKTSPNEIALHFNVRFHDAISNGKSLVVRTSRAHGKWGPEERDGPNPFQRGANFDILILIEQKEFKIAVNGKHFTSFKLRNPLDEANHVGVIGDVQIHSVKTY